MGLDMHLRASKYLYAWDGGNVLDKKVAETVSELLGLNEFEVKEITIDAAYWRKSNQIHRWFVHNVQDGVDDCGYYDVSRHDIITLKELCQKVLDNRDLAATELPTESGFFFGGTKYDEWYYSDLEETVKKLEKVLALDGSWDFKYHSSW